jgi:hypothetical protein
MTVSLREAEHPTLIERHLTLMGEAKYTLDGMLQLRVVRRHTSLGAFRNIIGLSRAFAFH